MREHLLEVLQLLAREPRQRGEELGALGTAKEQAHRGRVGLLLAVRVVDQDVVEMQQRALDPPGTGRGSEVEHGPDRASRPPRNCASAVSRRYLLARPVGLPERAQDAPAQPRRVDVQDLAQVLEREWPSTIATLDPGEIATERAGSPPPAGEQTAHAILEYRKCELQLPGEWLPREANRHAAAARLVWRLTPAPAKLRDMHCPLGCHRPSHTLHRRCTDGRAPGLRRARSCEQDGAEQP